MKVLIAVTHLLGTGHLSRALTLGRAFVAAGDQVAILSGGLPAPQLDYSGVELIQMPPIASDGTNFTRLLDGEGREVDDTYRQARKQAAVDGLASFQPDALIVELFPFGRRSLADEFLALIEAAKKLPKSPRILCSIRDILAPPSKPAKAERAEAILKDHFDAVLVHSDPRITALDASWPVTPALNKLLRYTGFVAQPPEKPHPEGAAQGEVLVSAGGGSVGQVLFETAIDAARLSTLHWRLLIGGKDRDDRVASLKERAGDLDITIEPVRSDFRQMLHGVACSVSMCGYNTALDLLQTGVPAVLVPFDDGGEVEQSLRAKALSQQPAMEILKASEMTPETMAQLVERVIGQGRRSGHDLQMDGATEAVRLTHQIVEGS